MVKLIYGDRVISVDKTNKFLSIEDQKRLLNGDFVVDTGVPSDQEDSVRKSYYIGVLFELFKRNYEEFSDHEIFGMMIMSYPIFLKERQIQNHLYRYNKLKDEKDVFSTDW